LFLEQVLLSPVRWRWFINLVLLQQEQECSIVNMLPQFLLLVKTAFLTRYFVI
jgi:hypothetical protein